MLQTGLLIKLYQLTSVHSRDNLYEDTDVQAGTLRAEERRGLAHHLEVGNPTALHRIGCLQTVTRWGSW
jgi:hypothetical protein